MMLRRGAPTVSSVYPPLGAPSNSDRFQRHRQLGFVACVVLLIALLVTCDVRSEQADSPQTSVDKSSGAPTGDGDELEAPNDGEAEADEEPPESDNQESAESDETSLTPMAKKRPSLRRGTALYALAGLQVKGRAPKTSYDRDRFGSGWVDTDNNSCSTRADILRRDLRSVYVLAGTDGCEVVSGRLSDPYTDATIRFRRGATTSDDVQIDHVVSLSDAWQKGAQSWSSAQRVDFANDPLELLAVDGPTNAAKSDSDAASWLPPEKSYRCTFVARQITIKARYDLWVTAAEKAAMERVLSRCPTKKTTTRSAATQAKDPDATIQEEPEPEPEPESEPKPEPEPEPGVEPEPEPEVEDGEDDGSVHYRNCDAVRASGADPIRVGDPGYSRKLDRDGDGVGCE